MVHNTFPSMKIGWTKKISKRLDNGTSVCLHSRCRFILTKLYLKVLQFDILHTVVSLPYYLIELKKKIIKAPSKVKSRLSEEKMCKYCKPYLKY